MSPAQMLVMRSRLADASSGGLVSSISTTESGPHAGLDVHEVAKGELEEVQPVDVGEVDRAVAEQGADVVALEEVVAGERIHPGVVVESVPDLRRGIDADRLGAGQRQLERGAELDADLDVGARQQRRLDLVDQIEVEHAVGLTSHRSDSQ